MQQWMLTQQSRKKRDLENQVVIPLFLKQPEANKQILLKKQPLNFQHAPLLYQYLDASKCENLEFL